MNVSIQRAGSIIMLNKAHQSGTCYGKGEYIGRPSPLGNPFVIGKDGTRDDVIEKYKLWLTEVLYFKDWGRKACFPPAEAGFLPEYVERMTAAYKEFDRLLDKYVNERRLALVCWCSPKRCHGDVIADLIETRVCLQ